MLQPQVEAESKLGPTPVVREEAVTVQTDQDHVGGHLSSHSAPRSLPDF